MSGYRLTKEDEKKIGLAIAEARVESWTKGYALNAKNCGKKLPPGWKPPDKVIHKQVEIARQSAQQIVETHNKELTEAAAGIKDWRSIRDWFIARLAWKLIQIAAQEISSSYDNAVDDFISDLGPETPGNFRVYVEPGDSSSDFCRDYAGNDYDVSDYDSLPSFPAHFGCIHYKEIRPATS